MATITGEQLQSLQREGWTIAERKSSQDSAGREVTRITLHRVPFSDLAAARCDACGRSVLYSIAAPVVLAISTAGAALFCAGGLGVACCSSYDMALSSPDPTLVASARRIGPEEWARRQDQATNITWEIAARFCLWNTALVESCNPCVCNDPTPLVQEVVIESDSLITTQATALPESSASLFGVQKFSQQQAASQQETSVPAPKLAAAPPQGALPTFRPAQLPVLAFGRAQWAMHLGDVDEEPPLPADIEKILASPCPFWPGKRVCETHMLTLIPARVKGQPLTMKLIGEFVKGPRKGSATQYGYCNLGEYADPPVVKAHWVLMTRDVLKGTRAKSYADQVKIVAKNVPYKVPSILDATVSIFVEHVRSGAFLYGRAPVTYTRCQEKWNKDYRLAVGGFAPAGLLVYDDDVVYDCIGVGAMRQFVRHEP